MCNYIRSRISVGPLNAKKAAARKEALKKAAARKEAAAAEVVYFPFTAHDVAPPSPDPEYTRMAELLAVAFPDLEEDVFNLSLWLWDEFEDYTR